MVSFLTGEEKASLCKELFLLQFGKWSLDWISLPVLIEVPLFSRYNCDLNDFYWTTLLLLLETA